MRRLLRFLCKTLLLCLLLSALPVLLLRWVNPPITAVMLERKIESWQQGKSLALQQRWRAWGELPDSLKMAVIAGEDQRFAEHFGFDVQQIQKAIESREEGSALRGASTLSQQVAKNLFLWSSRSWLRKGLEAWFCALIELLWPKQRILEVYLNIAEWGDGVFGAEAAARQHFSIGAPYLNRQQASLLAAVLPNPHRFSASRPSMHTLRRAAWIRQQMQQLGGSAYLSRLNAQEKP